MDDDKHPNNYTQSVRCWKSYPPKRELGSELLILTILQIWLMAASLKSRPPSSCVSPLWAYIFSLVSYNDICPWVSPSNPGGPYLGILYLILPAKTIFFQRRSHSQVSGGCMF